tara:strand:- start:680 stop:811 length:132 start_codon:yes stop_codon:yes gene_type:complete
MKTTTAMIVVVTMNTTLPIARIAISEPSMMAALMSASSANKLK